MQPGDPLARFMPMLPVVALIFIYFMMIKPQKDQQTAHEEMLKKLKTGDKILTTGGLYGTITGFKGDDLEVQFSQTVKLTLARSAVAQLISDVKTGVVVR